MVQFHIMAAATGHRDLILPPEWHIGAEFRLTAWVHRRPDGTLRANTRSFVPQNGLPLEVLTCCL